MYKKMKVHDTKNFMEKGCKMMRKFHSCPVGQMSYKHQSVHSVSSILQFCGADSLDLFFFDISWTENEKNNWLFYK